MASRQGASGSASGGQLEEKLDLTLETDACLAATEPLLATHNNLAEALTLLGGMEKKCRTGNDTVNLARVCTAAVQACHAVNDNDALVATLIAWATKRSQKSSAIQALVAAALPYCVVPDTYLPLPLLVAGESSANNNNNAVEKQIRETLVVTLRDLTDGKLFLERERAQLTRVYATLKVRVVCVL